ncbi:hypothetical protein AD933_00455 [Acetobacter malorum]|uniref:Type I restriction modification DNA specificity domain-containing protein n=1 Tax=Acetobacter malorum TaxID=178901 RepID=A0A149S763_9PROT|nr:restriction endonuclease subunit S [Acetobacter malorum]KXV22592.1 hypothetical protein AD933_00455 [Acetobacter malorum]
MLPEGWRKEKLGAVAEFQRGFDLPQSQRSEGSVPIISSSGASGFHDTAKALAPGIVTGRYGSIGDVFYVEEAYWPLNTALWVKDFHGNYPKYLYYLLSNFDFSKFSDKTGVPGVNRNDLHAVNVLVPPLPEQKKIAEILSTWDRAIEGLGQLLANSQQQKKALMQQLLTGKKRLPGFTGEWKTKKLKDISKIYDGTHQTPDYVEIGVPFYSVEHLTSGNFNNTKFVSEEIYQRESKKRKIETDDILLTRIGDIGTARLIDWNVRASFYVSLALIKSSKVMSPKFFECALNSELFRRELWHRTIHVAFPKKINLGDIGDCSIHFPPLPEQEAIAAILTTADEEIASLESDLSRLRQEKKALMQQLLTGKRRVTVD